MRTVEVTDALQEYMESLVAPRDKVLARMEEEAHREGIPIVDAQEGALLSLLVRISGGKRVLELGTATGYSGIWLLRGTDGGTLTTYEMDKERARRARANFSEAGLGDRALVLEEDAVRGLQKLDARFDVCFIDLLNSFPSEEVVRQVFGLCLERLEPGGLLLADNALRQGEVVQPKNQQARNVSRYNELVANDPRLDGVVVPIRDGLSIARIRD
ncbi:MAG TPA: O-methyltransferase [Candidatus Dormibacteraeota bacterium]|nr:O-methyltransferase [Candidatus Dormibacteraeota bacterium]